MSPNVPTRRPPTRAPWACAQSSTTRRPDRARDLDERRHVDGRAHEVDGDHATRAGGDRRLERVRRQQVRARIDVDQPRGGTREADALGRGDERVRWDDDLVARADAERPQREHDRLGARRDADGVAGLAVLGELGLERLELGAHGEGARVRDAADDLEQLLEQRGVGLVEPGDRDAVQCLLCSRCHYAAILVLTVGAQSRSVRTARSAPRPRWCRPWIEGSVLPSRPGDLARAEADDVAQDDHLALVLRKRGERLAQREGASPPTCSRAAARARGPPRRGPRAGRACGRQRRCAPRAGSRPRTAPRAARTSGAW